MQIIRESIEKALQELGIEPVEFVVEHPKDEKNGDYACNVAMVVSKKLGKNPRDLAEEIVTLLGQNEIVEKVVVAGAGFINFYLKESYLWSEVERVGHGYGKNESHKGKRIMVEYTDPNPFKEMHIGHLMSNTIGEAIARLKEAEGAEVKRANYQGDVGLHVAKSIWGMREKLSEMPEEASSSLTERQRFMGQAYALGASKYEEDEKIKEEIHEINKQIYAGSDPELMELYKLGREWSLLYFETIYKRLGTKFDEYFFESETGKVGLRVVTEGLAKGVLELGEEGAVVYKGESEGLHTRVFRNKLGLPTYEAKDLGLALAKLERYGYDQSIIVTANEITEYFRVILSVMGKLYPELAKKTLHKPHGVMKLKSGKMSSRTGKVVTAEGLLDELKEVVLSKMGEREVVGKEGVADKVAVSALKYSVLKQAIGGDIVYEPDVMTNLEGDTGPYLLYTYARARSVLAKAKGDRTQYAVRSDQVMCSEERAVASYIYRYPEVVAEAAEKFAPHLLCTYLNELASRYNRLYNSLRILDASDSERGRRVVLTEKVAQILESGLSVLGIPVVEEM